MCSRLEPAKCENEIRNTPVRSAVQGRTSIFLASPLIKGRSRSQQVAASPLMYKGVNIIIKMYKWSFKSQYYLYVYILYFEIIMKSYNKLQIILLSPKSL